MRTVPVPGEILRTDVAFGLTFFEILTLGSVPFIVALVSLFIEEIPTTISFLIVGLSVVVVLLVTIQTPDGQTPLEWAPAAFKRRVTPDTYYLKPKAGRRARPVYQSTVLTATSDDNAGSSVDESDAEPATSETMNSDADQQPPAPETDTAPNTPDKQ